MPDPLPGSEDYAAPAERPPLGSYAGMALLFNLAFAGALALAGRRGRLPERIGAGDIALIGTAGHKLSRLISKDKVTAFLRAPFTRYQGRGGPAELEEAARGGGVGGAIGELLICPYCLGLWVVAAFTIGLIAAPRVTRTVAAVLSALTISDFLQIAYKAAEEKLL